jgi:integrase
MDPDMLVSKSRENPEAISRAIQKIYDEYNNVGSTQYASSIFHFAMTFFKLSKVELDLHCSHSTGKRRRQEYIPTLLEALRMAEVAGSLRNRLIILLLTYAGLRNSTLRALVYNEAYPEPLYQDHTIKREMERKEKCLIIIVHEIMKQHVSNACKNKRFYFTFLPPKVTECFLLYLYEMEKYGCLPDSRPIFTTENRRISLAERLKTTISMRELEVIVKMAAKRAGIRNWLFVYPHCLRKTYESFLRNQPDDVRLDIKEREFFFGHKLPGSQDTYFDKTKIEEMRAKYAKMLYEPTASLETEERVVLEDDLEGFLKDGWHFEATLPSGRAVVSRKVRKPEPANTERHIESSNTTTDNEKVQTKLGLPAEPSTAISQHVKPETNKEPDKVSVTENKNCSEEKLDSPKAQDQSCLGNSPRLTGDPEAKEVKDLPKSRRLGQTDLTDFTARKTQK